METNKLAVPFAIVVAGILIAGSLYLANTRTNELSYKPENKVVKEKTIREVSQDDHVLGNPNAELLIVEYSDPECPYCKDFHLSLRRLMSEYGESGKVAWVYRHFPIDSLHPKVRKEITAAECAGDLGGEEKFWEYLNMIYEKTPSNNGLNLNDLPKFAKELGLNEKAFNSCLDSDKFASKIQADYEDAVYAGAQGTPYSVLITKDGVKTPLDGAYPYNELKTIIDAAL